MFIEGEIPNVVTTSGNGGYGNGGFFNGDGIWAIILFAMIFGRNGNGSIFGGGSGVGENYVLATDFATIERKLDSVNSGICDATFALNNTITNGNFNILNTLTQAAAGLNTALLQGNYSLSSRLAGCCCDIRQQISDCCCTTNRNLDSIRYENATNTCAITNAINNSTRDIIESQNANYRAIHEELVANKLEAKNDRIAEQQAYINKLELKASQAAQNAYLLNELKPCPSAAYIVPNPNCCYNYNVTGFGYGNNGCGCC